MHAVFQELFNLNFEPSPSHLFHLPPKNKIPHCHGISLPFAKSHSQKQQTFGSGQQPAIFHLPHHVIGLEKNLGSGLGPKNATRLARTRGIPVLPHVFKKVIAINRRDQEGKQYSTRETLLFDLAFDKGASGIFPPCLHNFCAHHSLYYRVL